MKAIREVWNNLAVRIQGMEAAILGFARTVDYVSIGQNPTADVQDKYQINAQVLVPSLKECYRDIIEFREQYREEFPAPALTCLERFEGVAKQALGDGATTGRNQIQSIIAFVALRTELNFYLFDRDAQMRKLVERAFLHLKRRIIVEADFAKQWQEAYNAKAIDGRSLGETACEKLGAIQLLQHGIWAFKAHSERERTDLVLGIPIDEGEAMKSADTLVLTEWKKVNDKASQKDVDKAVEDGIKQAKIYTGSSLAGFEIHTAKYIPIVSWDRVLVNDCADSGILYRVINIPVCPSEPSKSKAPV